MRLSHLNPFYRWARWARVLWVEDSIHHALLAVSLISLIQVLGWEDRPGPWISGNGSKMFEG